MLAICARARSATLSSAAHWMTAGWFVSVAIWRWVDPEWRYYAYAALDMCLALVFLAQSRGRWFPVPLFFLHAGLVVYHCYAALIAAPTPWVSAFINRTFELAMAYLIGCASFRLFRRARKSPRKMINSAIE